MSVIKARYKVKDGAVYKEYALATTIEQVDGLSTALVNLADDINTHTHAYNTLTGIPSTFTPAAHTHGAITNTGTIGSDTAVASGHKLVTTDGGGAVRRSGITFGTTASQYLRNNGVWAAPDWSHIDSKPATATRWPTWSEVTSKPSTFAPSPHPHTSSEVGLGNVQNYGIATKAEAETGTANEKYMTPLRTKEAIENIVGDIDLDFDISTQFARGFLDDRDNGQRKIWTGNATQYSAVTPDPDTIYMIDGESEELNLASRFHFSVTVPNSGWSSSGDVYIKTVTVTGMTVYDTPIVDVILSGNTNTDSDRLESWAEVYRVVTNTDTVTLTAFEIPNVELPIHLLVVR